MNFLFMVSGYSGTGKDEACNVIRSEFGALQLGMTDPARRHMMDIYGWTEQQMFGPSAYRNAGDPNTPKANFERLIRMGVIRPDPDLSHESGEFFRSLKDHMNKYPAVENNRRFFQIDHDSPFFKWDLGVKINTEFMARGHLGWVFSDCDPQFFLSPREALQVHCENMNSMYECTWVRSVFQTIETYRTTDKDYDRVRGFIPNESDRKTRFFCLADLRHRHEMEFAARSQSDDLRVITIRVRRPSVPNPPFPHRSETEQATIPDSAFDFVLHNDGSLQDFHRKVSGVVRMVDEQ